LVVILISYFLIIYYMFMNWLPEWLGSRYFKLLEVFNYRVFSVNDACRVLGESKVRVRVILSELYRRGWVIRLERGYYFILSPYAYFVRGEWEEKVKQKVYLPLILALSTRLFEWLDDDLVSIAVFGSVARGEARSLSDLDVVLVSKRFPKSYSERVRVAVNVIDPIRHLKLWLWNKRGVYCNIELLMLSMEEATLTQPVYLDMIFDSIIVYDRNRFLSNVLERVRSKMESLGAERVELPSGKWFWRLKPRVERGEVIEL